VNALARLSAQSLAKLRVQSLDPDSDLIGDVLAVTFADEARVQCRVVLTDDEARCNELRTFEREYFNTFFIEAAA
jgi:hypothetical protein